MFFRKQETNWLIEKKEEVKEQTPKGVRKTSNQASGENKPQNYVRPPIHYTYYRTGGKGNLQRGKDSGTWNEFSYGVGDHHGTSKEV